MRELSNIDFDFTLSSLEMAFDHSSENPTNNNTSEEMKNLHEEEEGGGKGKN